MTAPRSPDDYAAGYRGDPLFKGCTRPPMLFGVPVVPCILVAGSLMLLAFWVSFYLILAVPASVAIMRAMVKDDDQKFRLLGLKLRFRLIHLNRTGRFWQASSYSPLAYTKRRSD
ncbi:type IV secretion system protein VirB3 (plasmid) [Agrobacterium sp. rho-13.3]|uniref:type IV secretion system protein VirB3 n=1 Tax=Agrobacterium sp. rho-13.3 TaxID=3072980 RepID=UPI002A11C647|nr:type IV secretion system protein VirB3 [Agrobacterium sp. rho-13.3]MDX8311532.1 type IV secretion system protein VirB3 [Agrobacterium sp. rho-13.3]